MRFGFDCLVLRWVAGLGAGLGAGLSGAGVGCLCCGGLQGLEEQVWQVFVGVVVVVGRSSLRW